MASPPSTSTPAEQPPAQLNDEDLEKVLNREATAFQRQLECDRIIKAFKLNPYDILDVPDDVTPEEIKKKYRQLSLYIHPDKCSYPRAPEAFDLLKKAEAELSDSKKRADLDAVIMLARTSLLKSLSLPTTTLNSDPALKQLQPSWQTRLRESSKTLLIDEEVRRRTAIKMNLANEGLEIRKKEEEAASKKRKAEEDKAWEENREHRVDSWRSFTSSGKKKKKAKVAVLG